MRPLVLVSIVLALAGCGSSGSSGLPNIHSTGTSGLSPALAAPVSLQPGQGGKLDVTVRNHNRAGTLSGVAVVSISGDLSGTVTFVPIAGGERLTYPIQLVNDLAEEPTSYSGPASITKRYEARVGSATAAVSVRFIVPVRPLSNG